LVLETREAQVLGKTISHYQIVEKLGSGGMGEVYKAEDLKLHRPVALKFLSHEFTHDAEERQRFAKEAIAASALDDPNIGTIHEIAEEDNQFFIVMSYYEGGTLKEKITSRPAGLEIRDALDIAMQIARGLTKAHKKGIVHRDIKPGNILFTEDGQVKIIDFGLAKLKGSSILTKSGTTLGTVAYMSPEQAQGLPADQRSDVWSLGVILYEMLTGKRPFQGEHEQSIMYLIINEEPEFINKVRGDVPHQIARIVEKALAKKKEKRFSTMKAILEALETAAEEIQEGILKKAPLLRLRRKQRQTVFRLIMIGFLIVASGIVIWLNQYKKTKPVAVALLPIKNTADNTEQEWFTDSMTGALTFKLAQISGLRVTSLSSTVLYKEATKPAAQIAKELGVRYLVESSAEKTGDRVLVSAGLIDATKDKIIWADDFEGEFTNIRQLQGDIAKTIAKKLQAKLTPFEEVEFAALQPVNPETYTLITRGLFLVNKLTPDGISNGMAYLHQAAEIDPEEPQAHAGLALGYAVISHTPSPPPYAADRAREAAMKALELDSTLAEAHLALGMVRIYEDRDREGAEHAFQRALELNSSLHLAHDHYGWYLFLIGETEKALAELQLATEIDPLSAVYPTDQGWIYYFTGDHDRAIDVTQNSLEMYPDNPYALCVQGFCYGGKGMYDQAIDVQKKAVELSEAWRFGLGFSYAKAGQTNKAIALAAEMESQATIWDTWGLSVVYAGLDDGDKMFYWLEEAYRQHHPFVLWIRAMDNFYGAWYDDPRFIDLAQRMNLPGYNEDA
jgi:serine/threonine protein kinase/Flp pilus assembly protein TadD